MTKRRSSGRSSAARGDSDRTSSGGVVNVRRGGYAFRLRDEAEMRAWWGDAEYERWERSQALSLNPRPLSARQAAILREAVAPLLRDMEATGQALPDIQAETHADRGTGVVCAWIRDPGGTGRDISVHSSAQRGDQLSDLAEQLQDWARDAQVDPQRPRWPDCPAHPGGHRLEPEATGETAVWWCPQTARVIAEIGALGSAPRARVPRIRSRRQRTRHVDGNDAPG